MLTGRRIKRDETEQKMVDLDVALTKHVSRVRAEDQRDGLNGYHGDLPTTERRWIAECSCGWVLTSGVAVVTFSNRENARDQWRDHKWLADSKKDNQTWADGTVRLPAAIESWLDGHFAGEKGDDPDELDAARKATEVALWSLIYRQGDEDTDQAAIAAFIAASDSSASDTNTDPVSEIGASNG